MRAENEKTKVIGRQHIQEEYPEEYNEFNNAYGDDNASGADVDELAYLDEVNMHDRNPISGDDMSAESYAGDYDGDYGDEEDVPEAAKRKKKKKTKKSKKAIIIAVVIILALIGGGTVFAYMKITGPQDVEVDLVKLMNDPEITGYDGEAKVEEITLNQDGADKIIAGLKNDGQKEVVAEFFASVEYSPDKVKDLSNGDKINISANYDKKLAEAAKVTVTAAEGEYEVKDLKEDENKLSIDTPQWYRLVLPSGDELSITCLLLADVGTSVTLPIQFMFCQPGGAMSEMVDTGGTPDITYNGTGYFMEDGVEAPVGKIVEIDNNHIIYSVKQYGNRFKIKVNYTVNKDGTINVESASGGEAEIPTGRYEQISENMAESLGATD